MKRFMAIASIFIFTLTLNGCFFDDKTIAVKETEGEQNNVQEEEQKKPEEEKNVVEEKPNKNNGITIVIDPGHSSKTTNEKEQVSPNSKEVKLKHVSGAAGVKSKKPEYEIVVDVALKLEQILKDEGFNVVMTKRTTSEMVSNIERAEIGNNNKADLAIRLHCDSINSQEVRGASMLLPKVSGHVNQEVADKSKVYGENIIKNYTKATGIKNRGLVYRGDLTGFNWSKVPVVLIELGFLSNPTEDGYLSNKDNHDIMARGIADGIIESFK